MASIRAYIVVGPTCAKPGLLQRLGQRDRLRRGGGHVGGGERRRSGLGPEGPDEGLQAAVVAQGDRGAGVGDGGVDLAPVAHDAGVGHQPLDVGRTERRDGVGVEAGEGLAEARPLVEDGQPRQAGLERLQGEPLEVGALPRHPHPPLGVVVGRVDRVAGTPRAARDAVRADDGSGTHRGQCLELEADVGQPGAGIGSRSRSTTPKRPAATDVPASTTSPSAVICVLPLLAEADDLLVGAADEVPPHDDRLAERRSAEHQQAGLLERGDGEGRTPLRDVGQVAGLDLGAVHLDEADVEEHAVLEGRVDLDLEGLAGREHQLGAEQGRVGVDRRARAEQGAEEDPRLPAGAAHRLRREVLEAGVAVTGARRAARSRAGRRAARWWPAWRPRCG